SNPKIVGVMSTPRFGPIDTMMMVANSLATLGIETLPGGSVFWEKGLECKMEDAILKGADYILTIDYDGAFEKNDFLRLLDVM
ncbi:hypothetical protein, partial [Listeria monocytogenes]|uniref:hypothetical protein n=1 Tax=Listeria monocytogenes TaxID=1639 RepID=UPI002FDC50E5